MEMTVSDESVIVEAHSMLHEIQWAEDHEDTWPNNPLEVVAMLQKVTRYAAFLESRLYADAAPTPPPADTDAGDAALRKLDAQMIGDAVHQARYTIQAMQEDAAEDNYAAAFEHLAVVLVNHNLALDLMQKGETR
jgi:hypothetical protein